MSVKTTFDFSKLRVRDLSGKKFGRLHVVGFHSRISSKNRFDYYWECICDCGRASIVSAGKLSSGHTKSCGCLSLEKARLAVHGFARRGKTTKEYNSWNAMIGRCLNPENPGYKNYGARGIGVCKRWLRCSNFILDMGVRPPGTTLERVDNNKGYSKSNCIWATKKSQGRNRRSNVWIEHNGVKMVASDWSAKIGKSAQAIIRRLRLGIPVDRVLFHGKLKYGECTFR